MIQNKKQKTAAIDSEEDVPVENASGAQENAKKEEPKTEQQE